MAVVIFCIDFGVQENEIWHCFHISLIFYQEVLGLDAMTLVFWMLSFKPAFSTLFFHFHQEDL